MATYNGDNGNNTYFGTQGDDVINGLGGNDALYGQGGNDTLNGGTGNDTLRGGLGNDTYLIAQGDGTDTLNDREGADVVKFANLLASDISVSRTSNGYNLSLTYSGGQLTINDYFYSTDTRIEQFEFSDGTVWGWADIKAHISLTGTGGNDWLYGYNNSNDTLNGLAGNDGLTGYDGNDTLNGGTGNDWLDGGLGNDTYLIAQGDGTDTLFDGGGTDVVKFTNLLASDISVSRTSYYSGYNDGYNLSLTYSGGQLTVQSYFYSTDDRIEQFQFSDGTVWGWADIKAHISLTGTGGNDWLYGYNNSNDTLNGLAGNDSLTGYGGNDSLMGGGGNDVLNGGLGNDILTGGAGQDRFIFSTALGLANIDTVTDFTVADDTVQLAHSLFTALSMGVLAADQFKILGNGGVIDGNDHILYNSTSGVLSYDTDGNGAAAAVQIAILGKSLALTFADFVVV